MDTLEPTPHRVDGDLDVSIDDPLEVADDGVSLQTDEFGEGVGPALVAIGASAGGLEALEKFFESCPHDAGATYVVIQHLAPDHKSLMPSLLGRRTRMPVLVAEEGTVLLPDRIYLLPPAKLMRVEDGRLLLTPKAPQVLSLPIDIFFSSMAASADPRMVAVILSGTGSDGTRGAAEVNGAGGLVLAQDPASAKFDGMPRSVIGSGMVDAVLPVDRLAAAALAYIRHPTVRGAVVEPSVERGDLDPDEALEEILRLLHDGGEIDFRDYKPATVMRRIERRMQIRQAYDLSAYLQLLAADDEESSILRQEMLIGVTRFFRDPEAFDALARHAVERIVERTPDGETIRVWHAGCSTGEEAYSVTILFLEELARRQRWCQLKLFATDVDELSLEQARRGVFSEAAAAELDETRLDRYFEHQGHHYVAKRTLRQHLMFARHNLLTDAPFTRMDLAVCRNTLIYFKQPAQERALAGLQYALRPNGFLFLGPSESLSSTRHGFSVVDARHKLFRRLPGVGASLAEFAVPPSAALRRPTLPRQVTPPGRANPDAGLVDTATQTLVDAFVPPSLLVSAEGEVVHLFGDVGALMAMRQGAASLELIRLLPDGLASTAQALAARVLRERAVLRTELLLPAHDDHPARAVMVLGRPVALGPDLSHVLISVLDVAPGAAAPTAVQTPAMAIDAIAMLEQELASTRESLQVTIEELETSNEELQATNEELISANEELQSSNEELQSLNEELNTVNAEYQEKGSLLQRTGADLDAMARAAGVAMIFVDSELRLTRFTPDAQELFNLRPTDVGRPISDITHRLDYADFVDDLRGRLDSIEPTERHVTSRDGTRSYLVRLLPCSSPPLGNAGAAATFVDATAFHDAKRLQGILDTLPEHIAVLAEDGTIALVNEAWRRFAAENGAPDLHRCGPGTNYLEVCEPAPTPPGEDDLAVEAAAGVRSVLDGSAERYSLRYPCHSATAKRWFVMNVAAVRSGNYRAVVSHVDITPWYPGTEHG